MIKKLIILTILILPKVQLEATEEAKHIKPSGIILSFSSNKILKDTVFKRFLSTHQLKVERVFKNLNMIKVDYSSKTKPVPIKSSKQICFEILKKFSLIQHCEGNKKLQAHDTTICPDRLDLDSVLDEENLPEAVFKTIDELHNPKGCSLLNTDFEENTPIEGLSSFWAQEYTGADLLRERMEELNIGISNPNAMISVWDTGVADHGNHSSNLIAGPHASSALPSDQVLNFVETADFGSQMSDADSLIERCSNNECVRFINQSMGWGDGSTASKVVENLVEKTNVVFVTSAGNENRRVSSHKVQASQEDTILIVGSFQPNGETSIFSNYSEEVVITAPSNSEVLSFSEDGSPWRFGGTSGAAPQVTGALAAFELISGFEISTELAKTLLEKSSIKMENDPERLITSRGFLNTYKMGEVAFKIKEKCSEHANYSLCAEELLRGDNIYNFQDEVNSQRLLTSSKQIFPLCNSQSTTESQKDYSCEERAEFLKKLRGAALLTNSSELWRNLSCIYELERYHVNANFYSNLARGSVARNLDSGSPKGAGYLGEYILSNGLQNHKETILSAISFSAGALEFASDNLKSDREVVLAAVSNGGSALQYASESLRSDPEIVRAAVSQNIEALSFASDQLLESPTFMSSINSIIEQQKSERRADLDRKGL